ERLLSPRESSLIGLPQPVRDEADFSFQDRAGKQRSFPPPVRRTRVNAAGSRASSSPTDRLRVAEFVRMQKSRELVLRLGQRSGSIEFALNSVLRRSHDK